MEISAVENLKNILKSDKKMRILLILGFVSILIIFLSDFIPASNQNDNHSTTETVDYTEYIDTLETKTTDIVESISGAGKCKVMITLKNTNEGIYAQNISENTNESSNSSSNEYVLYNGNDGEEPILIKEYFPEIQGVAIVCEGADNIVVKENIINSVSSLYGISSSKICVSKLKS